MCLRSLAMALLPSLPTLFARALRVTGNSIQCRSRSIERATSCSTASFLNLSRHQVTKRSVRSGRCRAVRASRGPFANRQRAPPPATVPVVPEYGHAHRILQRVSVHSLADAAGLAGRTHRLSDLYEHYHQGGIVTMCTYGMFGADGSMGLDCRATGNPFRASGLCLWPGPNAKRFVSASPAFRRGGILSRCRYVDRPAGFVVPGASLPGSRQCRDGSSIYVRRETGQSAERLAVWRRVGRRGDKVNMPG